MIKGSWQSHACVVYKAIASLRRLVLEAFVTSMADLDLRNPFRGKHLVRSKTTRRDGVEDGVYHVTTLALDIVLVDV